MVTMTMYDTYVRCRFTQETQAVIDGDWMP
jgi:hypothetical protein